MANTYYFGDRGKTPATIYALKGAPQDTVLRITPEVSGGTTHYVKLSGKDSKVVKPTEYDGYVELLGGTKNYWLNNAREAYKNQQDDGFWDNFKGWLLKHIDSMPTKISYGIDYTDMYKKGAKIKNQSEQIKKDQQGDTLNSNQLGQLAKAAFQMATEFKKQGAITEIAGEQAIAQVFQQTPEAAKMFVAAAQKQDAETILKLFTQLGIVK